MQLFRQIPATFALITINVAIFIFTWVSIGTFQEPQWTFGLLRIGAEFNPYTLDKEWYRIFTHMFLHGSVPHLILNMYGLFVVGSELERLVGTTKLLWVYFVSGVAAALTSLYFGLFAIGVGASGAIFGLFGFDLIIGFFLSRQQQRSVTPLVVNFVVFLAINLAIAKAVHADTAAHIGGLVAGAVIGLFSLLTRRSFAKVSIEYAMTVMLVVIFFALPRYQVTYFKFFQKVLDTEEVEQKKFSENHSDAEYLKIFERNTAAWDSALMMLDAHTYLPDELSQDTFKLRRYIRLRKIQNEFRTAMIERESYVYLDSIAWARDSARQFMELDHHLSFRVHEAKEEPEAEETPHEMIRVWYDSDWVETPYPPAPYYRVGYRDSLGRWQGQVQDFYANGDVQMKGSYKDDKRDGIFLYYSDHKTYTSAGRYDDDRSIGRWETYHDNGRLASEAYYTDRYFLKSLWDSLGNQQVKNGEGKEIQYYPNGVVKSEGEYIDGYKQGYWRGYHKNGELYFEENYSRGRLIIGRSRNLKGEVFNYDESSFFPIPEGGFKKYKAYLESETDYVEANTGGTVRLSFRVTPKGVLTDFIVEKSLTPSLDKRAKEIIRNGPAWIPAKAHGQEKVDGVAFVDVDFKERLK